MILCRVMCMHMRRRQSRDEIWTSRSYENYFTLCRVWFHFTFSTSTLHPNTLNSYISIYHLCENATVVIWLIKCFLTSVHYVSVVKIIDEINIYFTGVKHTSCTSCMYTNYNLISCNNGLTFVSKSAHNSHLGKSAKHLRFYNLNIVINICSQ